MTELRRALGLWQCVFLGVGSILGAGIYVLVGEVAQHSGNFAWLAFGIASFCAILTTFSYAELSSMFPKAGGEFVYAEQAFGRKAGLFVGLVVSASGMITAATVSLGFAGYLGQFLGGEMRLWAWAVIGLVFAFNVIGIRASSGFNIVLTLIELAGLGVVAYAAFPSLGSVDYFEPAPEGTHGIFAAASLAFFAYVGFEEIVKLSEETREPEKNIPRALFIASGVVALVYLAIALLAVSALPWKQLGQSKAPLTDIVAGALGSRGAALVTIAALFSTTNTILSNMLGSSRVLWEIGRERKAFSWFSYLLPNRRTPVLALLLVLAVAVSLAAIGDIGQVARLATLAIFVVFFFVNLSVIVLRLRKPDLKRPYRIAPSVAGVPIASALGVLATLALLGYSVYALVKQ